MQHFPHATGALALFHAAQAQAVGDVFFHIHVREKGVALKHGVDVALLRRQGGDVRPVQKHAARVRRGEPGDDAQRGGLAAAGGAEQRDKFACFNGQRYAAQHVGAFKSLVQIADLQHFPSFFFLAFSIYTRMPIL